MVRPRWTKWKISTSKKRVSQIQSRIDRPSPNFPPRPIFIFLIEAGGGPAQNKIKIKKVTAPSIPVRSPITVLTGPSRACLRRSDGIRNILVCMAVTESSNDVRLYAWPPFQPLYILYSLCKLYNHYKQANSQAKSQNPSIYWLLNYF